MADSLWPMAKKKRTKKEEEANSLWLRKIKGTGYFCVKG